MIRVHTGRGWRYNPHLLAELRSAAGRQARHLPIFDVLGMEVDGVDLFSGLSEDRIVDVTAELAAALSRLASGYRRAQVSCSGGAVELLLERSGPQVRLSLVRLRRPAEVLLRDLEVDLGAVCAATLRSARGLLEDLRRIHPGLAESPPAQRLVRALQGALGKAPRPCQAAPGTPPAEGQLVAQSRPAGRAGFRLEVIDDEGLFQSFAGGRADLHSLLGPGVLLIEPGGALPSWSGRGVPFLLLKDLVQSALEVVRAIEEGDPEQELALGSGVALELRLGSAPAAAFVRETSRGRQQGVQGFLPCEPVPLLAALFQAALAFGTLAARRNARQAQNQPLATLLTDAHEGLARCREVASAHPAGGAANEPSPAPRPPGPEPRLAPGRLRLLTYREAWARRLPFSVRRLQRLPGSVVVQGEGGVALLKSAGTPRWVISTDGALVAAVPDFILVAHGEVLERRETNAWQIKLGGPIRSLACAGERGGRAALAATDTEAMAISDRGQPLWRFAPPGATRISVHAVNGLAVISTGDGRLYGVGLLDGKLAWRARGRLLDTPVQHRNALLTTGRTPAQLSAVTLGSGAVREMEDLDLSRIGAALSADWGLAVSGLRGAEGVVLGLGNDGRVAWRWMDERLGPARPLLLGLPRGLLVRSARSLSRLEPDGTVRWSHPLSEHSHDGVLPVRRRGVVLSAGDAGLFAFDEESGAVLGQVDDDRPIAALAVDAKLNVFLAAEDGPVRSLRVERFLSVV